MWQRDFAAVYKALNTVKWSDTVAEIMMLVQGSYSVLLFTDIYSEDISIVVYTICFR